MEGSYSNSSCMYCSSVVTAEVVQTTYTAVVFVEETEYDINSIPGT